MGGETDATHFFEIKGKMSVKIYQATNSVCLSTSVFLGENKEKEVTIAFERGANAGRDGTKRINGCFYTGNPVLQKALESDKRFGRQWILIGEEEEQKLNMKIEEPRATIRETPQDEAIGQELVVIEEVTNKQQAIEFLSSKGVEIKKSESVEKIHALAKEKGYSFQNWK